jgi:hypothetical protein
LYPNGGSRLDQMSSPAAGRCYVEHVAFLHDRPNLLYVVAAGTACFDPMLQAE